MSMEKFRKSVKEENKENIDVNIGEIFSLSRERNRDTISNVASSTNLSSKIISLMESNKFSQVGSPVYVRGYIKIYATYLGLDYEYLQSIYNKQNPEEHNTIKESVAEGMEVRKKTRRNSKALSGLVVIGMLAALFFGYSFIEGKIFNEDADNSEISTLSNPDAVDVIDVTEAASDNPEIIDILSDSEKADNLANDALEGIDLPENTSLVVDIPIDADEQNANVGKDKELVANKDNVKAEPAKDKPENTKEPVAEKKPNNDKEKVVSKEKVTITITFKDDCWVKLVDTSKEVLYAKLYKKGDKLTATGVAPFILDAGIPKAIDKIILGKKEIKNLSKYKTGNITYTITND